MINESFSVSQINRYLKNKIETDPFMKEVWVRGEISNFKAHYSGHLYFTLKDENSSLKAVMFKTDAATLKFPLKDGMEIIANCRIGVYEPMGSYQAYVKEVLISGEGELNAAFIKLKEKLLKEGLFEKEHKKEIPMFPEKIGVVTSLTGAAIRDICNVLSRRYPVAEIVIYPSLVQGEAAPASIIKGIEFFNKKENMVDVLIVGRGGGSIEDLWAFNDEQLARTIFASKVPVISAVGHETDFTICDFVSDLRAPTPSAAAELAAVPLQELQSNISSLEKRLIFLMKSKTENLRLSLKSCGAEKALEKIKDKISEKRLICDEYQSKLFEVIKHKLQLSQQTFKVASARLDGASPLKIMEKGYAFVTKDEKAVKKVSEIKKDDTINLILADGKASAKILEVKANGRKKT